MLVFLVCIILNCFILRNWNVIGFNSIIFDWLCFKLNLDCYLILVYYVFFNICELYGLFILVLFCGFKWVSIKSVYIVIV